MSTLQSTPPQARVPMHVGLMHAVRRRPQLLVVPVVVLAIASVLAAVLRSPTYTSSTRLSVARIDATTATGPSFQDGVAQVANTFAALVSAPEVLQAAATELHVDATSLAGRVSAAPVPASPFFTVTGTGGSSTAAVNTANVVARALVTYIARIGATNPDADRLLRDYEVAARAQQRADATAQSAVRAGGRHPTATQRARITRARALAQTRSLKASTLAQLYQQALSSSATANVAQVMNPATVAASNRRKTLVNYVVVAVLAGLLLGLALALVAAGSDARP
ncbi:MAG: Wzz/FepE/Etk N-terminal domain-containing protein [Thermoleophilia bacterium]